MARFDVYRGTGGADLLLDCQSDLLRDLNTRFVVPLQRPENAPQPARRVRISLPRSRWHQGCKPVGDQETHMATAATLPDVVAEMVAARTSERQGRVIDHDEAGSMEKKKRQGYF